MARSRTLCLENLCGTSEGCRSEQLLGRRAQKRVAEGPMCPSPRREFCVRRLGSMGPRRVRRQLLSNQPRGGAPEKARQTRFGHKCLESSHGSDSVRAGSSTSGDQRRRRATSIEQVASRTSGEQRRRRATSTDGVAIENARRSGVGACRLQRMERPQANRVQLCEWAAHQAGSRSLPPSCLAVASVEGRQVRLPVSAM